MEEKELMSSPISTDPTAEVVQAEEVPAVPQQSDSERNLRELREQKGRIQRERDDLQRRMEQMEAQQKAAPQQPALADDDLVEWKHVKQEIDGLKSQLNNYQKQSVTANAEARLKSKYTDFDQVVNPSNIERLKEQYPEIAQTLSSNQDLYSQASAAYDIIKRYGIHNPDVYQQDKARVQENASKPRALNTASGQRGESPLDNASAFADGLTPDLKKQLYKEMQEAIKRR